MSLAASKTVYGTFSNAEEWVQVVYDFSVDAGATGDYDVLTAGDNLVVTDFYYEVQTAVTSGGSLVVDLGVGDGGTEFLSDTAVAALTLAKVDGMDTDAIVNVKSAEKIVLGLEAATALTGKVAFNFKIKKV